MLDQTFVHSIAISLSLDSTIGIMLAVLFIINKGLYENDTAAGIVSIEVQAQIEVYPFFAAVLSFRSLIAMSQAQFWYMLAHDTST